MFAVFRSFGPAWTLLYLFVLGCRDPALPLALQLGAPSIKESLPVARAGVTAGGMALAWRSLPPPLRSALSQSFGELEERLRMHMNPLWVDLEEDLDEKQLRRALAWFLPILTAASALAPGQWQTPDAAVRVHVVPRLATVAGAAVHAREAVAEPVVSGTAAEWRRARFAAWAITHAVVVQAPSAAVAAQVSSTLQWRLLAAGSVIGLVVLGEPGESEANTVANTVDLEAVETVRRSAAQLLRVGVDQPPLSAELLHALAELPARPGLPAWLPLTAAQVLIVPRLSAVAADAALRAEVQTSLAAHGLLAQVRVGSALPGS